MTTPPPATADDPFPRQKARTRGFRLGAPRSWTPSPDGRRVAFLRSGSGTDPVTRLWVLDVPADEGASAERVVVDPVALLGGDGEDLSPAERARRERLREVTAGVTAYDTDDDVRLASFALSGRPYVVDLDAPDAAARELPAPGPVLDPRPDPTGRHVAFVCGRGLHVIGVDGSGGRALCEPETDTVAWGTADFIASEELDRYRGFWWAPDGSRLLVERYDEAPVRTWWLGDPSDPAAPPQPHRYPQAGTDNAHVSLWLVDLEGAHTEVEWDRDALPYLTSVHWSSDGDPLVAVLSRDQRRQVVLVVDPADGSTRPRHEATDAAWVDVVPGVPRWAAGGRLVLVVDDAACDTRRVVVDGVALSPPGLQVRGVLDTDDDGVVVSASTEPVRAAAYHVGWDGTLTPVSPEDGWSSARIAGDLSVVASTRFDTTATTVVVRRAGRELTRLASFAEVPAVRPVVEVLHAGPREVRTAVLWPTGHRPGSRRLPVILSPYGGPHGQRVVASGMAFATEQWLADQGFCVVVADGAGTPGRGPAWEREVHLDLATPVLADQVAALEAVVARHPDDVDPGRVGIRGWSFGGYLAALAVIRRPDVVHAAVAGAPVTDLRLYDTAYSERYLGDPRVDPAPYDACSLVVEAAALTRPLMLVHGLADDNVSVAHTLALSGALLAAGRPHTVLPLSGVTHMTPQEVVAENLLRLEVAFLRDALSTRPDGQSPDVRFRPTDSPK